MLRNFQTTKIILRKQKRFKIKLVEHHSDECQAGRVFFDSNERLSKSNEGIRDRRYSGIKIQEIRISKRNVSMLILR